MLQSVHILLLSYVNNYQKNISMRSKKLKFFIVVLLSLYLIAHLVLYVVQADFLFIPSRRIKDTLTYSKRYELGEIKDFYITTPSNIKLHVWYKEPEGDNKLVLLLHGQAGHLGDTSTRLKALLRHNYGFFAIDYRGYGKSDNVTPNEEGIYEDVDTALKYIKDELKYDLEKQVILIGESMGGAPATYLASKNEFYGVMLIAPFTSIRDVAIERYWYLHFIYPFIKKSIFQYS